MLSIFCLGFETPKKSVSPIKRYMSASDLSSSEEDSESYMVKVEDPPTGESLSFNHQEDTGESIVMPINTSHMSTHTTSQTRVSKGFRNRKMSERSFHSSDDYTKENTARYFQ